MPKIVYANIVWFGLIVLMGVNASLMRHKSSTWQAMPDVEIKYDVLFVGVFGLLFLISSIGLLKKKQWGYQFTMAFNAILTFLVIVPFISLTVLNFEQNISLSQAVRYSWDTNNFIISFISLIFIILMNRKTIKSIYNNTA